MKNKLKIFFTAIIIFTFYANSTLAQEASVYDAQKVKTENTDFGTSMNLPPAPPFSAWCVAGSLIKTSVSDAVYYCGNDGKRYVFVNDKSFKSWYTDFSNVKVINAVTMSEIMIGGNVTYRPGSRMLKIQSDPKVYAVDKGGIIRWVSTEQIAVRLYGESWNKMVDDVSDSFFINYKLGDPITQ